MKEQSRVQIGFYADDFTGAAANLSAFQRMAIPSMLYLRTPSVERVLAGGATVIGVAGISRSLPAEAIPAEILPAFSLFDALGVQFVQYKVSSTFDSACDIGSLAPVLAAASAIFGSKSVPVVVASPAAGRYTVFGNHFAKSGCEVYRLDRHPIMSKHPSTPMLEPDLRVHLERQIGSAIGLVAIEEVMAGVEAITRARLAAVEYPAVVFDALSETDIDRIAIALMAPFGGQAQFVIAAQGLAAGLARQIGMQAGIPKDAPVSRVDRLLVLSGSASGLTRTQIARALDAGWAGFRLDNERLLGDHPEREKYLSDVHRAVAAALKMGRSAVVYSALGSDDPTILTTRQLIDRLGLKSSAFVDALGDFLGRLATMAIESCKLRRISLAGGDSSSRAMRRIDAYALNVVGTHRTGSSMCRVFSDDRNIDGLEVHLKGGQIGSEDIFLDAHSGQGWA